MQDLRKRKSNKYKSDHYVYKWQTEKDGEVLVNGELVKYKKGETFYVGKGKGNRAKSEKDRNNNTMVVLDVCGKSIVYVEKDICDFTAEKLEVETIKQCIEEKCLLTNFDHNSKGIVVALKHRNVQLDYDNMSGHTAIRFRFEKIKTPKKHLQISF